MKGKNERYPDDPLFKGLQRPLEFMGSQGRYIYWAAGVAGGEVYKRQLVDWKRVESEVRVITPDFQVWKGGKLKTVVIYAKMCRGETVSYTHLHAADGLRRSRP